MNLVEMVERPELDRPVLVLALDGWIDAGQGAATAASTILDAVEPTTLATFDTDALLDHRARRPVMHLVDGVLTDLSWPELAFQAAADRAGNDVLLLFGPEPDHSWGAFSAAVVELAEDFGARLVVGLGAYPAPAPHTRGVRLASTASTPELVHRLDFVRGSLDVPAGVQAAIEQATAAAGIPSVGIWAQVPHYAATMPYPAAGAALIDGLKLVADLDFDASNLERDAKATADRLDSLVAESAEHQELVAQLELHVDAEMPDETQTDPIELTSGDELAADIQRFLREQD